MEALKLSDVFPVQRPRLTAIEETSEHDCLVHCDFRGQLDVPVIHNSGAQATHGRASFTDTTRNFLVEGSIRRYDAPRVPQVIVRLHLSSRYGLFGRMGCCVWSRLVQGFCFAETDCDSEVEEVCLFRKSADVGLDVRPRVCYEDTVISKQCVGDQSLEHLSFNVQSA